MCDCANLISTPACGPVYSYTGITDSPGRFRCWQKESCSSGLIESQCGMDRCLLCTESPERVLSVGHEEGRAIWLAGSSQNPPEPLGWKEHCEFKGRPSTYFFKKLSAYTWVNNTESGIVPTFLFVPRAKTPLALGYGVRGKNLPHLGTEGSPQYIPSCFWNCDIHYPREIIFFSFME